MTLTVAVGSAGNRVQIPVKKISIQKNLYYITVMVSRALLLGVAPVVALSSAAPPPMAVRWFQTAPIQPRRWIHNRL